MKKIGVLVLILLVLSGCSTGNGVKEDTITIGWAGALSGELASLGNNNMRGVMLAVDEINANGGINGKRVEVVYEDDQWNEKLTRNIYEKFTKINGIDIILTTTYGGLLDTADSAESENKIVINTVDTSEELAKAGDNSFAIGIYDESIGYAMADFFAAKKKIGIIYLNDPFAVLVKDALVEKYNGEIVFNEAYNTDTADFKSHLIKANKVEGIAVIGFDESGFILKQAKELGIEAPIIGIDTFASESLYDNSQGAIKGAYFTFWEASNKNKIKEFEEKFRNKFGEDSDHILFAVTGYDAMNVLAEAMRKSDGSVDSIKSVLYKIKNFDGLAGSLTMDSDGVVRSITEEIYMVEGKGEFIKV